MSKEEKMLKMVKKLSINLIKLGAKLDKHNIPFKLNYQNETSLKGE